jgi:hypothetical protein
MFKPYVLLSAMLFGLVGLAACGQESPIQLKITPALTEVRNNQAFSILAVVRNAGKED